MGTIQKRQIDQILRKIAEIANFLDIYAQDYSNYFKDSKDNIYLKGEKHRLQDISPKNIFSFVNLKNELSYIMERLTI